MLCDKYDITPTKERGQNFLVDKRALGKIVETADLSKNDTVLEIGPGMGVLTIELARRAGRVLCVEIDGKMVKILQEVFNDFKNIEIVHQNILRINLDDFGIKKYKIVSNIPYKITTLILEKFLTKEISPELAVFLLQKEVAERISAKPPEMSALAIFVQFYGESRVVAQVPKHCFWPQPRVDSAIVEIKPHGKYSKILEEFNLNRDEFFKFVHKSFSSPRRQLQNNLKAFLGWEREKILELLEKLEFNAEIRAEELGVKDWVELFKNVKFQS